ncbi:MAG: 4Fe-4S dicluster domain-containing protein [Leptolyngbya sp. PLA1]|nr:4Fe-4S dicluster domain-containing protein [Leptolyngbya sp. PLA1]
MTHDQCHSTTSGEKQLPGKDQLAEFPRRAGTVNGQRVWRSPEDLADNGEFRDWLEREFPSGMGELVTREAIDLSEAGSAKGGESRREFLKIMSASLALAGAATIPGCRRPDHKILPYSKVVPEDVVPGRPLFYATSFVRPDGGAEGLLVETHEGRPTKIEGNPLHPANNGKCSIWALASIMGLYDPDRLKSPVYNNPSRGRIEATWDDFRAWAGPHFGQSTGEGLAFIVGKSSSPSRRAACDALKRKFPKAEWVDWAPAQSASMVEGTRIAFGAPMHEVLNLSKQTSRVILSLDRDFLQFEPCELTNARGFARSREIFSTDDDMSRLYAVESGFSGTGGQADHRLRLAPSRVTAFAVELAKFIAASAGPGFAKVAQAAAAVKVPEGADLSGEARRFLEECAKDLASPANNAKAVVLAGPSQPAAVHALVAAINSAIGAIGSAVSYSPMTADEAADSAKGLAALTAKMKAGQIKTLVCVGANPAYDAPGDLDFAGAWAKVPNTVTLSVESTETAAASTWSLNSAHYLESWGDALDARGVLSPVQPVIAPIYEPALSELEFLTLLASNDIGHAVVSGHQIVRDHWRTGLRVGGTDFEKAWRRALHDGLLAGTGGPLQKPAVNFDAVASAVGGLAVGAMPTPQSLDVAFSVGHVSDGRFASCAWLHELPETGTRTVWDNPALMSPKTAEALGLLPQAFDAHDPSQIYTKPKYPMAAMAELTVPGGGKVISPVWIMPGMADNTVLVKLGFGRTVSGRVADGVGVNFYAARPSGGALAASGATAAKVAGEHMIASTQNHWSLEGRTAIVRAVDLPRWKKFGGHIEKMTDTFYGTQKELGFGEQLGELAHTPANVSIYKNPFNRSPGDPDPRDVAASPKGKAPEFSQRSQWAMTIDQTLCTGCGACTIACQSENNIPVVGKKEVAKGREMTWMRVDRYFTGDFDNPQAMLHQPVCCVHCENAPCETVCPVNATVHGPEGMNYMTYNRCIGTRYCANNCPYKVRRYNFFEYGKLAFNGDYAGKDTIDSIGGAVPGQGVGPNGSPAHNRININLVPPRLREKISELERMQKNPDVTVRMRGVMEKCSFCVQRINGARIETKLKDLPHIPDGFFQVACQQACPSDAITFGDMLDLDTEYRSDEAEPFAKAGVRKGSKVAHTRRHARNYALLGYLNTRPRVTHMVRIMNPNPALCDEERKHLWDESPVHHGGHEGHDHAHDQPHSFVDPSKHAEDRGYALSLRVLPGSMA